MPAASPSHVPQPDRSSADDLAHLDIKVRNSLASIHALLLRRPVTIAGTDLRAWGQWLDDSWRLEGQWGRFGSSAAVQILASTHALLAKGGRWTDFARSRKLAVDELFPSLLPDQDLRPAADERQQAAPGGAVNWKETDFRQPLKVAFCVDALAPECNEVHGDAPALVERLLALKPSLSANWTTRSEDELSPPIHESLLVTAFCLLALRRFPQVHDDGRVVEAFKWLANHATNDGIGPDLRALCGLALLGARGASSNVLRRDEAIAHCDRQLAEWIVDSPGPLIERPWFNPYVRGTRVDYMFLSPEIVVSLYVLRRGLTADGLVAYANRVVEAIVSNVGEGGRQNSGLRVQAGQIGTVDQMWAVRLLLAWLDWWDNELRARRDRVASAAVEDSVPGLVARTALSWRARGTGLAAVAGIVAGGVAIETSEREWVVGVGALGGALAVKALDAAVGDRLAAALRRIAGRKTR